MKSKFFAILLVASIFVALTLTVNAAPDVEDLSPADGDTGVDLNPTLSAVINTTGAATVYFYYNGSAGWVELGNITGATVEDASEETVTFKTNWAEFGETYMYSVNVTDTIGWTNKSASFTLRLRTSTENTVFLVNSFIPIIVSFAMICVVLGALGKVVKF